MKFFTAYGEKPKTTTPTGEKIEVRHRPEFSKDGRRTLIADKKIAIYEKIQMNREECEIENIIRRAVQGDYNALNQAAGQYADITGMPQSIAEAQQMVINLKETFDGLPKEVKAKFEFNPELYVAEFGTKSWAEKTGLTEKLKAADAERAAKATFETNMAKAVENIATGVSLTQTGGEVNE